jgi:hypothetical protein
MSQKKEISKDGFIQIQLWIHPTKWDERQERLFYPLHQLDFGPELPASRKIIILGWCGSYMWWAVLQSLQKLRGVSTIFVANEMGSPPGP